MERDPGLFHTAPGSSSSDQRLMGLGDQQRETSAAVTDPDQGPGSKMDQMGAAMESLEKPEEMKGLTSY